MAGKNRIPEIAANPQAIIDKPESDDILDCIARGRMGVAGIICNDPQTWDLLVAMSLIFKNKKQIVAEEGGSGV